MLSLIRIFGALYLATLIMQTGSSLLMTYLALRLNEQNISEFWNGTLMSTYALGIILGGKLSRKLISQAGHIRAYVACAGIGSASVLAHAFSDSITLWLVLRFLMGLTIMCQLVVLESWFNECAQSNQRGIVLALYMTSTYVGSVLGQLLLALNGSVDIKLLISISIAFSLCLVPVALTRSVHPTLPEKSNNLSRLFFLKRLPQSLMTILAAGMLNSSFYGLGPVFAEQKGLNPSGVGQFMALVICAGLVAQWPLGLLSDRLSRSNLIRTISILLAIAGVVMGTLGQVPMHLLFVVAAIAGALHFCLYPLGVALANDNIEPEFRVSLAGSLLVAYGVGAAIGPIIAGSFMQYFGLSSLYYFFAVCGALLALSVSQKKVSGDYLQQDAPLDHPAIPNALVSSTLAVVMESEQEAEQGQDLNNLKEKEKNIKIKTT